jgi:hypothetical protein
VSPVLCAGSADTAIGFGGRRGYQPADGASGAMPADDPIRWLNRTSGTLIRWSD